MSEPEPFIACSNCFVDEGLRLDAEGIGEDDSSLCPRCATSESRKLTPDRLATLAQNFFVWGSVHRVDYGAAPQIQFNDRRKTDFDLPGSLSCGRHSLRGCSGRRLLPLWTSPLDAR